MTTQITGPIGLGHQGAAFKLLHQMAVLYPDMPAAYIVVQEPIELPNIETAVPASIRLQVDVRDFEPWRARLGIRPEAVTLRTPPALTFVSGDTVLHGVAVHISGHLSAALTTEQIEAPRVIEIAEVPA